MRLVNANYDTDRSEVNLTPMLDVVFIMLVFFVVTATFLDEVAVPVYLPATGGEPPPDVQTIAIRVEATGTFVINERVVSRSGLVPYLKYLVSRNRDASFAVLVARDAAVGDTVAAIDAGRQLGFDVVPITPVD